MDPSERSFAAEKAELVRALDDCRRTLAASADEFTAALDLRRQLQVSFAQGKWRWLAGALALGTLTGLVGFARKGSRPVSGHAPGGSGKTPFPARVLRTVLWTAAEAVALPVIQSLLRGRGEKWLERLLAQREG